MRFSETPQRPRIAHTPETPDVEPRCPIRCNVAPPIWEYCPLSMLSLGTRGEIAYEPMFGDAFRALNRST